MNKILDTATYQLLALGYDKMSYTTLSKETGISRTGISHHFPKKTDFTKALEGRFIKIIIDQLNCDSSLKVFEDSWHKALNNDKFMSVFRLAFHHSIVSDEDKAFSHRLITAISDVISHKLGEDAGRSIEWLVGVTLISMTKKLS
ncbi:TetR family transcriptional regulator [Vibrio makurazakiensis]|uniref:TetR family transcriptional regulator n=1 Tax=Vibrio makurazakiensis TaxID=2910250 RepID=UPI003D09D64C